MISVDSTADSANAPHEPTLEELVGRPPIPRLRIHHLLVATAVVAVLLWVTTIARGSDSFGLAQFVESGVGLVYAVATGLALSIVAFGFRWRWAGFAFFHQPGHWLLLGQALAIGIFALAGVSGLLQLRAGETSTSVLMGFYAVYALFWQVATFGLSLWVAWKVADSRWWRAVFLVDACIWGSALICQLVGATWLLISVSQLSPFASIAVVLVAAWQDRRHCQVRDWAHWLGVVLRLASYAAFTVPLVWAWLARAAGWGTAPM